MRRCWRSVCPSPLLIKLFVRVETILLSDSVFFVLAIAGPLPTLDGITNREGKGTRKPDSPQITVFPPVSEDQLQESRAVFWQAGPLNGLLNGASNRFTKIVQPFTSAL